MGTINKNKTKLQMRTFALVMTAACAYALDANGAEQFAEGFMQGVFGSVEGAVKCIRDIKRLGSEVETTIGDLKSHSYIKAIREVGTISHELGSDLADCKSGEGDAEALIQQLEDIYSGSSWWSITFEVGKNVLVNGVDVYQNITGAISDYGSSNWESFGTHIGTILKDAAGGSNGFDGDCEVPTGVEFGQPCRMRELCGTGCGEGKCVWTWPTGSTMDDEKTKCGCSECSA